MSKAVNNPLTCEGLKEVRDYVLEPGIKVSCTSVCFSDLNMSYAEIVSVAEKMKTKFHIQVYSVYPNTVYFSFNTHLDKYVIYQMNNYLRYDSAVNDS